MTTDGKERLTLKAVWYFGTRRGGESMHRLTLAAPHYGVLPRTDMQNHVRVAKTVWVNLSAQRGDGSSGMCDIAEDELYEMVNLPPRLTGLPMTVWARPHDNAQHDDVSIKVNMTPGVLWTRPTSPATAAALQ